TTCDSSLRDIAAFRRTEPRVLVNTLRGDLDWIVMRCLEKDRARRYETANALAIDMKRHLNQEPVLAGPPTLRYRASNFIHRTRAAAITSGLVAGALLVGIAGTTWQAMRARQAEGEQRRARGEAVAALAREVPLRRRADAEAARADAEAATA